jgi:hypothetical protein
MVKITSRYTRATSFAVLTIALVAAAALLTGLVLLLLDAAGKAEPERQRYLVKLASLAMGALVLSVVVLVALVARYVAYRLTNPPEAFKPMGYESAWKEAGRRLRPEDAPPVEGFEDRDEEDADPEDQPPA